jgi:hypothetical protein
MTSVSATSNTTMSLVQASLKQQESMNEVTMAVAAKSKDIEKQQAANMVALIDATKGGLVDVRA